MRVKLISIRGSKMDAIRVIRSASSMDLDFVVAKRLVEQLPFGWDVSTTEVERLDQYFEFEILDETIINELQTAWGSLTESRQIILLQILDSQKRLRRDSNEDR